MNTVGIYRSVYPWPSETFITQQATHLHRYRPTFLVRTRTGATAFPTVAINDRDPHRLKQILHTLTRSPRLFPGLERRRYDVLHAHFAVDAIGRIVDFSTRDSQHGNVAGTLRVP